MGDGDGNGDGKRTENVRHYVIWRNNNKNSSSSSLSSNIRSPKIVIVIVKTSSSSSSNSVSSRSTAEAWAAGRGLLADITVRFLHHNNHSRPAPPRTHTNHTPAPFITSPPPRLPVRQPASPPLKTSLATLRLTSSLPVS